MARGMRQSNSACWLCCGIGTGHISRTAFTDCLSSHSPKGMATIDGCKCCSRNVVMDANHGKCIASFMDCPPKILAVGFQMELRSLAAMLYVPLCPNVGSTCGRNIAHLGQNDNAWSVLYVMQNELEGVASSHNQGAKPLSDIYAMFSQRLRWCIPSAVQQITLSDCALCVLHGRRSAACSGSSPTTKSSQKKSYPGKRKAVKQSNLGSHLTIERPGAFPAFSCSLGFASALHVRTTPRRSLEGRLHQRTRMAARLGADARGGAAHRQIA